MKIQTDLNNTVESQGVSGTGSFSIKTSGHAFRLLSSGLYTNKIQAVVRELSCNAADAHVLNGNQAQPFDVKIPNALDGQFYIRDYGPGMSEKDVMSLYTTYFESTKQNSNDFTGGFGVGSKSPFAYTDMFTVVSIHNNLKTTYTAYVDDNGEPKIVKLGDAEKTTEPSGLSVGFPVKPDDQKTFALEARNVLGWFQVPVNVLGVSGDALPKPFIGKTGYIVNSKNIALAGTVNNQGFSINKPPGSHTENSLGVAVMGNVHYPFPLDDSIKDLPEAKWFARHAKAIFKLPVGSVSVAASREALAFDKFTKAAMPGILKQAFKEVAEFCSDKLTSHLKAGDTLKAHQAARKMLKELHLEDDYINTPLLDAINATPEQRKLLAPRFIYDPKHPPKTFSIVPIARAYGHDATYQLGSPSEWDTPKKVGPAAFTEQGTYTFIENGARMSGVAAAKAVTTRLQSLNKDTSNYYSSTSSTFMIVPKAHVKTPEYEAEREQWLKYTGAEITPFSKIGEAFKNDGIIGRIPYNYQNQEVELREDTPPFFWMTETEYLKTGGSPSNSNNRNYHIKITPSALVELQKNLGFKTVVDKMYVIADADADKMAKKCPNGYNVFEDFAKKTLLAPKMQTKIAKIHPMMAHGSSTFSALRAKLRKDQDWIKNLGTTKIGEWFDHMMGVKGTGSYDYTTRVVLKEFQRIMGAEFPSAIPECYNGIEVEKTLQTQYPFLQSHVIHKVGMSVDQLKHMRTYVDWCETNGAAPPAQAQDEPAPAP